MMNFDTNNIAQEETLLLGYHGHILDVVTDAVKDTDENRLGNISITSLQKKMQGVNQTYFKLQPLTALSLSRSVA